MTFNNNNNNNNRRPEERGNVSKQAIQSIHFTSTPWFKKRANFGGL